MKKKVCKTCKVVVDKDECPICKGNNFSTSFQGRMYIMNAEKSYIAKRNNIKQKGEYVIKVR